MSYRVVLTARARRDLKGIPQETALRIGRELEELAGEPDPRAYVKKLQGIGNPPFYSLRVGSYRVIMNIVDEIMVIHVIEVGHRSTIYRT
jgi:mRNA interferase RelE/StbE